MSERESFTADTPGSVQPSPIRSCRAIALLILAVTLLSLATFYFRGLSNLYGDGIAHMEGARRYFDSVTPGYAEMGSVWLPLYHVVVAPLSMNDFLWRTGLGGSLVSAFAFGIAAWFLFRLGVAMNGSLAAGVVVLAGFLLCPNMLYLASTPLTEPMAILWMVLAVHELSRYQREGQLRPLVTAAGAAFCCTLTRYDGWFFLFIATLFILIARPQKWSTRFRDAILFLLISGAGPLLWLIHNAYRFGNPLEFYNGPHSAQAIYAHQVATTGFRYPTDGDLLLSARYYVADLQLVIGTWPLVLALLGLVAWAAERPRRRQRLALLLFLVPFFFYVNSLAHGGVPLYVPTLFPNTYYNLRYGLEMMPAVALLPSFLVSAEFSARWRWGLAAGLLGIILGQGIWMARHGLEELAVVKEGILNTPCRSERQQAVIRVLRDHYGGEPILVAAGKWPCVLPELRIPIRKTISESNGDYWERMCWEPDKWVEWVIRGEGDRVDALMRAHPHAFRKFEVVMRESIPGEGSVAIYRRCLP